MNLIEMLLVPTKVKRELKRRDLTIKNGLVVCDSCGVGCGQCSNSSVLMRPWKHVVRDWDKTE